MDEIREGVSEMETEEGMLLATRTAKAESGARTTMTIVFVGALLSVTLVAVAGVLVNRDFAERKRAEEERDRIWSLSRDLLCIATFDGYFKAVNPAWEEALGFSCKEMTGKPFVEFVHPDDRAATTAEASKLREGGESIHFENRYLRKDGSYRWLAWNARSVVGEKVIYATARDVTEQNRAKVEIERLNADLQERAIRLDGASLELQVSEARYRTLFDSIDEGFCIIEVIFDEHEKAVDYVFLEINPSFEKQTGLVNALGKSMRELAPGHEEHWFEIYGRIALTGEPARFQNHAARLHRWYDVYAFRHGDPNRRQVAILFNNITVRKRAEQELSRLNAELAQHASRMEAANKELEAFSYSVSHDLRAPLRHIDGYVGRLARATGENLDEKSRRYLKIISEAAKEMGQLIDDLLVFSRMGRMEMQQGPVELSDLAQGAIGTLAAETQGRKIRWKSGELPVIAGDASMLRQVFINLLSNAVKYTRPRDPAEIEIGCSEHADGEVVVFVRDNGVGFEMEYVDKLFGVFQRLHRADQFEGTGIGLANVRRIVERHGGRTWAEGEVDRGATFYFSLPKLNKG